MKKRITSFLTVMLLFACLPMTAFAHEVPNLEKKGSIEITMKMGDQVVPGGKLICSRVGDIAEEDGNYSFRRLDGEQMTDVSSPDAAKEMVAFLKDYQKKHSIDSRENTIGEDGKVKFQNLKTGLYLMTQENPPSGYYAISPFLVSIPENEDGHYIYDVTIRSKTEPKKTTKPSEDTPSPEKPRGNLPQTGQLNWPIPILFASGLLLLVIGHLLRKGTHKHET